MANTSEAWERVGDRLSALALKLKLHAQEGLSDEERPDEGFERFRAVVNDAMDGIHDTYEDEAVRADARNAWQAFVDALDATIADVDERLRSRHR